MKKCWRFLGKWAIFKNTKLTNLIKIKEVFLLEKMGGVGNFTTYLKSQKEFIAVFHLVKLPAKNNSPSLKDTH